MRKRRDTNYAGANQHGTFGVWSEAELTVLKSNMEEDENILAKRLPGRTPGAIRTRKSLIRAIETPDQIVHRAKTKDEAEEKLREMTTEKVLFLKRGESLTLIKSEKEVNDMANRCEIYPGDVIFEAYPKYKVKVQITHA